MYCWFCTCGVRRAMAAGLFIPAAGCALMGRAFVGGVKDCGSRGVLADCELRVWRSGFEASSMSCVSPVFVWLGSFQDGSDDDALVVAGVVAVCGASVAACGMPRRGHRACAP